MTRLGCLIGLAITFAFALPSGAEPVRADSFSSPMRSSEHAIVCEMEHRSYSLHSSASGKHKEFRQLQFPIPKPTSTFVLMIAIFTLLGGRHLVLRRR